jgi:anthranilate synthase component 1
MTAPAAGATTRFEDFARLLAGRRVVPVVRELFADGETPVGIYRKLAAGRPGTFLLESAEQGGIWSRYSFVGAGSYGVLTEHDGRVQWLDYGLPAERALGEASGLAPLAALEALYERAPAAGHRPGAASLGDAPPRSAPRTPGVGA